MGFSQQPAGTEVTTGSVARTTTGLTSAATTRWAIPDTMGPSTKRDTVIRSLPSPLPSPPFPTADWDGAPLVGVDATPSNYPLQKALRDTAGKVKFYGWVDVGGNVSSSKNSNSPTSYDLVPNSVQLDQAIIQVTRQPNTAQTDHFDWGFLGTVIFGTDYRYTTGKGYFSNQLLKDNHLYGVDPAEIYGLFYFPKIADGMILKVGRYISPADIEAQWAPTNYLYSHSLMFTVDPYTFTGVQATFKLGSYWQLEVGAHAGNDMAPWSNSAQLNGLLMARWVSKNNNNSLYGGINSLGNGDYKNQHDDLQMVVITWGHKFNETFHMMTEAYYMWQYHALTGGTVINGPAKSYDEGVGPGVLIPGAATTQGAVNYFQILLNKWNYFSIRNDLLNDPQANRTGFATLYTSHTIGYVHFFGPNITIRPEVRYEQAWQPGVTPYDNGTKKNQKTAAMDLIVRF
jgi:Putative beta-barrel porin-2, OmpL-like. bbp2